MHTLGKALQALGLVLPLVGLLHGIEHGAERGGLMLELMLLGAGGALFLLGTALVRR